MCAGRPSRKGAMTSRVLSPWATSPSFERRRRTSRTGWISTSVGMVSGGMTSVADRMCSFGYSMVCYQFFGTRLAGIRRSTSTTCSASRRSRSWLTRPTLASSITGCRSLEEFGSGSSGWSKSNALGSTQGCRSATSPIAIQMFCRCNLLGQELAATRRALCRRRPECWALMTFATTSGCLSERSSKISSTCSRSTIGWTTPRIHWRSRRPWCMERQRLPSS
mmetsp:Transcript_67937/g.159912  ORF Transcript_67937/g.159912 Transcript_67937/m.159912 type:complete len:222 (-) Transcript_67937:1474-2139(-)